MKPPPTGSFALLLGESPVLVSLPKKPTPNADEWRGKKLEEKHAFFPRLTKHLPRVFSREMNIGRFLLNKQRRARAVFFAVASGQQWPGFFHAAAPQSPLTSARSTPLILVQSVF